MMMIMIIISIKSMITMMMKISVGPMVGRKLGYQAFAGAACDPT